MAADLMSETRFVDLRRDLHAHGFTQPFGLESGALVAKLWSALSATEKERAQLAVQTERQHSQILVLQSQVR